MSLIVRKFGAVFLGGVLLGAFAALGSTAAFAETSPEGTVKEFVGKIKSAKSPAPIVEYIDWQKAFNEFPEAQRAQLKLDTPDKLKTFFKSMLESPAKTMREQMEARLKSMPQDQQTQAKPMMDQLQTMMETKEKEMKERIAATDYQVSDEHIDGDTATVKLTQKYKGEDKSETIKLERHGSKWLLPSLKLAAEGAGGGAPGGAPDVAAPAPPQ